MNQPNQILPDQSDDGSTEETSLDASLDNSLPSQNSYYTTKPVDGHWDTIVIGSGISGLTCAAALSMTGDRVLVLEQHYVPGGYTHVFHRKSFEWDTGIHYLGSLSKESYYYMQLMGLTDGQLKFEPFGDIVDTLMFPDLQINMPTTYDAYAEVLSGIFPKEKDGIYGYLYKIRDTRKRLGNFFAMNLLPKTFTNPLRKMFMADAYDAAVTTTDGMLSRYVKDVRLKDVLDAQWGNIGMPRQRCSFLVSAAMLGYFLESGAAYPIEGTIAFAKYIGATIAKYGSTIRVKAPVETIIVHNNTAVGVRLKNGEEILAKRVISTAGSLNTYNHLVGDHPSVQDIKAQVNALPKCYEYLNYYFGLDCDPARFGISKQNYWIHKSFDQNPDTIFWDLNRLDENKQPQIIFLSFGSLRDPTYGDKPNRKGFSGQVVFFGTQGFFDPWKNSTFGKREDAYRQAKARIADSMASSLDQYFPGFKKHVVHQEIATPLTYTHFSGHYDGIAYGLAPIPQRLTSTLLRPTTPIKNLYLAGQDLIMPGISAAFGSAILTTSLLRRRNMSTFLGEKGKKVLGI